MLRTIALSVEALEADDNILLFPENPQADGLEHYVQQGGVSSFYTGFAHVGSSYLKKAGKCVTFYPVYAHKERKVILFGEGIRYRADHDARKERHRIAQELSDAMQALSKQPIRQGRARKKRAKAEKPPELKKNEKK